MYQSAVHLYYFVTPAVASFVHKSKQVYAIFVKTLRPIFIYNHFISEQPSSQQHQTLIIEEFEPDVFRQLIEYIHTGCVTLQPRTLLGKHFIIHVKVEKCN